MKKEENKLSEDLALNDLEKFVNIWVEKPESRHELSTVYSNIFNALLNGNLSFDENYVPTYQLLNPIKNTDGDISNSIINFKTRISPTNQARIAKGLDIKLDQLQFGLNCICYIIGEPLLMLDKFSKKDYNAIREISTVFM